MSVIGRPDCDDKEDAWYEAVSADKTITAHVITTMWITINPSIIAS